MITEHSARDIVRRQTLLLAIRQALLIILGALEDYMGMERSVIPKHKR